MRDLGIDRDTLNVFTTDNGPSQEMDLKVSDSNGYSIDEDPSFFRGYGPCDGIKRDCDEGGSRVGAPAVWPGMIRAGGVSETPSPFHDWKPTLAVTWAYLTSNGALTVAACSLSSLTHR